MMEHELETTLLTLLDEKQYTAFMKTIDEVNPVDAAEFFSTLPPKRIPIVFRLLKKNTAAEIFAELDTEVQSNLILAMTDREAANMIEELFVDDAVDFLEEMPAGVVKRILREAPPQTRAEINRFLSYAPNSAGSVMTSEFLRLDKGLTAAEAIEHIRRTGLDKETVYVAYVTNATRVLEGVVPLKKLLFAEPTDLIENIMDTNVLFANTHDDRESVAQTISHYGLLALPIVDKEQRLVGIVTVDDAIDVLESEATEDIEKMAAILPTEKPYLKASVWEIWKKRFPWLLLLMVSATFTGIIIRHYEAAIGAYAILTAFLPMLMGTGGNAGGQASVTVVRGLSLGEIALGDVFRVLWKELRVAALCGATLAAATFIKVLALDFRFQWTTMLESGALQNNLLVTLVISLTVFFTVILAKAVGALLPIGAKRIGLDPAVMANPFVTTIVDTLTLVLYFAIASRFLGI